MRSAPPPYPPGRWHQSPDPELRPRGWRGWRRSGPAPGNHTPHCRRRPLVQCPPLPSHWLMAPAAMLEGFQGAGDTGRRRRVRRSGVHPPQHTHHPRTQGWDPADPRGVSSCSIQRPPPTEPLPAPRCSDENTQSGCQGCGPGVCELLPPEVSKSDRLRDALLHQPSPKGLRDPYVWTVFAYPYPIRVAAKPALCSESCLQASVPVWFWSL